jgi:hypothetical protein
VVVGTNPFLSFVSKYELPPVSIPKAEALPGTPITLQVLVNASGTPCEVHLLEEPKHGLAAPVIEAVLRWKFSPVRIRAARDRTGACMRSRIIIYLKRLDNQEAAYVIPGLNDTGEGH